MKKNKYYFRSLRTELIVYAFFSMILTVLTEVAAGVLIYLVSRLLGKTYLKELGMSRPSPDVTLRQSFDMSSHVPGYRHLRRIDRHTIYAILLIIIIATISLFIIYFLLFMKRIVQDMSYISDNITHIATGNMTGQIEIGRQDELGEIVKRVNEMQEQLYAMMDVERKALQDNKNLITSVAHDLRTPVTSIMGYLELAMDMEHHELQERQQFAAIALQKAVRLERLIQDLFSYTKLMNGEITLHRSEIDLIQLVSQMVEEFYPIFQDHDLECIYHSDISSQIMVLDGEMIARAVQNLLSNAAKYGKDGKQITVSIHKLEKEIQICVTNFGQIIPEESLSSIFKRFYRVEESRSTDTGGTGLGLNIAYEIIQLHGGKI
ncbi:MAG: HAMP domain-containing histidine kinase, partial [Lachnospiraceae bacterium]|nr:HAMP domain-containing histidine kinase [Lachnospiraceae bacterium]